MEELTRTAPATGADDYRRRWRAGGSRAIARARAELRVVTGTTEPEDVYPLAISLEAAVGAPALGDRRFPVEDCLDLRPALDPLFVLAMRAAGLHRTGPRSFQGDMTEEVARRLALALPGELVQTAESLSRGLVDPQHRRQRLGTELDRAGAPRAVRAILCERRLIARSVAEGSRLARCAIVVRPSQHTLSVKVCTIPGEWLARDGALHRWPEASLLERGPVRPDVAAEACHSAAAEGIALSDPALAAAVEARVRGSVAVLAVPGMPGLCDVVSGQAEGPPVARERTSCEAGVRIAKARAERGGVEAAIADGPRDVARMAETPDALDPVLLPPQRRVVAAHLGTWLGFLNSSVVGSGKTSMTLRGQRTKALAGHFEGFRALIVCAKELREQWREEAGRFFPEAEVNVIEGTREVVGQLLALERRCGERPGLAIAGYEQVRIRAEDFAALTYDELVVDEAARLANPGSQVSRALWRLRDRAAIGIALTGTPLGRRTEEIDAIVAWCRDDREALRTRPMGRAFSGLDVLSRDRLRAALGPVMQRVTRAELAEYLPEVGEVEPLRISPTEEQRALIEAIDVKVAKIFAEILERTKEAQKGGSAMAAKVRSELLRQRGYLLSAVTSARMAKDPESLRDSDALVARMMEADGLLAAAIEAGSPPRELVARTIAQAVADEEQVLCFSDFTSHLRLLARELASEHSLEVPVLAGGTADPEALKARFQAGEERALLVGKSGFEGHNIQPASAEAVVIHYDLPWEPRSFEQRTGRAARLGAGAKSIAVLVPVLRDSIEERVARVLLPRAAKAVQTLATDGEAEPLAVQLEGLAAELGTDGGASTFLAVCRAVLAEHASRVKPVG